MKRTISLLLAMVMVVMLFAGCGAKEVPAADAPAASDAAM